MASPRPRLCDFALETGRNLVRLDFPAEFKVIQSVSKRFKPKKKNSTFKTSMRTKAFPCLILNPSVSLTPPVKPRRSLSQSVAVIFLAIAHFWQNVPNRPSE
jgi:hypothetical protein